MPVSIPSAHGTHVGVVIGAGRVGRALHKMGPTLMVRRGDILSEALQGLPPLPLYVCTTNDALEAVITQTPAARRPDLVFLQNGMLQPLLQEQGLLGNTQALLYLSVSPDGSCTDGRRTVACGRWAGSLFSLLHGGGLQCREVTRDEYLPLMAEKLLWSSIFWLLSNALDGLPVGQVATKHSAAVEQLVCELLPLAQRFLLAQQQQALSQQEAQRGMSSNYSLQWPGAVGGAALAGGVPVPPLAADAERTAGLQRMGSRQVTRALLEYSLSISEAVPSKAMALAEFEFRNGWFLRQQRTSLHAAWLQQVGVGVP